MRPPLPPVVISFGCPRSGTTFICALLVMGEGYSYGLLDETRLMHPVNSPIGLLELATIFRTQRVIFVRAVRHPLEIAESCCFLRREGGEGEGGPTTYAGRQTDQQIVTIIRKEYDGFAGQAAKVLSAGAKLQYPPVIIQARLEEFAVQPHPMFAGLLPLLPDNEANAALPTIAAERYGTVPSRWGRLKANVGAVMTTEQRAWFADTLGDVITAQGYTVSTTGDTA